MCGFNEMVRENSGKIALMLKQKHLHISVQCIYHLRAVQKCAIIDRFSGSTSVI